MLAFILATAFAFVTNKRFVFMSKNWELGVVTMTKDAISFVSTRIFTFLLEEAGLLFAVEILSADQFLFLCKWQDDSKNYFSIFSCVFKLFI